MKKHISKSLAAVLLSLFGLSSNVVGMENSGGNNRPRPKVIKHYNVKHVSTETSGQAIDYKGPLNILVIGGFNGEFEAKQLVALLCHNEFGLKLPQIQGIDKYEEGKVYELDNQSNIRVTYFDVMHFNNKKFMEKNKYDMEFITRNSNIVLYIFGPTDDCFQRLQNFYHTFNHWWCGKDYDYDKYPYKPFGDHRRKWFDPVLKAMGAENARHRYIYFLYYGTRAEESKFLDCKCDDESSDTCPGCKHAIGYFVAAMPDARSIVGDLFHENASINALRDHIFNDKESFQITNKFNNQNIRGEISIPLFNKKTEGTGFEKKENLKTKIITGTLVTAALLGTTGVAYKFYKKFKSKNQTSNKNQQLEIKDKSIKQIDTKSVS